MSKLLTTLAALTLLAIFLLVSSMEAPTLLQQVHAGYNHIQIYEDGSYVGQTINGQPEQGCINGGLCDE